MDEKEELLKRYLEKGWAVLPLHWIEKDGKCSCKRQDCASPGKHPLTPNGVKDASKDPGQVKLWNQIWPKANIGIATGQISGIVVVDIDPRNGGDETLAQLEAMNGPIVGPSVITGGGGGHIYLSWSSFSKSGILGKGIDYKSDGGFVCAPPSVHESGKEYRWDLGSDLDVELFSPPIWVTNILANRNREAVSVEDKLIKGGRNNALTSIAGSCRRKGLSSDEILETLRAVNKKRCAPPLEEYELVNIANSVAKYIPEDPVTNQEHSSKEVFKNKEQTFNYKNPLPVLTGEFISTGVKLLDDRLQGGLRRKELGTILAQFQHGKSRLLSIIGSAAVQKGLKVLHFILEDSVYDVYSIYDSIFRDKGIEKTRLTGELFFIDGTQHPINPKGISKLVEEYRPDVVIVDYGDLVSGMGTESERHKLRDTWVSLRQTANGNNCAIWTATQATVLTDMGGHERLVPEMDAGRISEAKVYKIATSDVFLGFVRMTQNEGWLTIMKAKSRKPQHPKVIRLNVDYSVPKIWE